MDKKRLERLMVSCRSCGWEQLTYVDVEDLRRFVDGETAEACFPYASDEERAVLTTRLCGPCRNGDEPTRPGPRPRRRVP